MLNGMQVWGVRTRAIVIVRMAAVVQAAKGVAMREMIRMMSFTEVGVEVWQQEYEY